MNIENGSRTTRGSGAMWIAGLTLAVLYVGSTLPTPLYLDYRRAFGFSEIVLTLIYASYVVGNLTALFALGRLSDQIGRRSVTVSALALAAVSTLLFLFAGETVWLFAARIVSGLAIGLDAGTVTAWIAELHPRGDKASATVTAAAFNVAGLGVGAAVAGLLGTYRPWPLRLCFGLYLAVLIAVAVLVTMARETVDEPSRLRNVSLHPRIGIPKEIALAFVAPAVTAFATFALLGFYAALTPSLLARSLHQTSNAVAGAVVGELFVFSTVTIVATKTWRSRSAMRGGLALLFPSVALLILAQTLREMPVLVLGTACSGVSAAQGYRGSLAVINEIAPSERRAEVVSSYLIACYSGNALPVIGIGVLRQLTSSLAANAAFAVMICVLATVALVTGAHVAGKVHA